MIKLLALASALTLAAISSIVPAQAGMRVGIGLGVGGLAVGTLGAMANENRYSEEREYRERRKSRAAREDREEKSSRSSKKSKSEKTDTASKSEGRSKEGASTAEASSIAGTAGDVQPQTATGSIAASDTRNEHSSIAMATGEIPAKASAADPTPVAKKIDTASQTTNSLDCKKFFPSAGMTLSVPCE